MAKIQCKMCGGEIELPENVTYGECPYCGLKITLPKLSDERLENLYNRAEHFRRINDYSKAVKAYEEYITANPEDSEAYWGLVLSRFGIEYVEDPASHERIPTCHRVSYESILADPDYLAALKYAGYSEQKIYESEAKRIAEIQKGILAISSQDQPFDVFICYKETDDYGKRTKDSVIAQDLYYALTNAGYNVFFSRITLESTLGQKYEPHIFAALNSAKVMLVVGSKKEYFEAAWVRNEWSRYLELKKKDRNRLLIPCYRDMDAYDIPEELSMFQSQDMGKIGFVQDILRELQKVLKSAAVAAQETQASNTSSAAEIQKLIRLGQIEREQQNRKALHKIGTEIISLDPENIDGWFFQAIACEDVYRAKLIFERIIKQKPDCAEYYLTAAEELSLFAYNANEKLDALQNAMNSEDYDPDSIRSAFDNCNGDIELLEYCFNQLRCVIDDTVPGIEFSEEEKSKAISLAIKVLEWLLFIKMKVKECGGYDLDIIGGADEAAHSLKVFGLLKYLYETSEPFLIALPSGNLSAIEKCLDEGYDVNSKDEFGETVLEYALTLGDIQVAKLLIDRGADVNEVVVGNTKLHLLAINMYRLTEEDRLEIIQYLLEHGADPNLLNDENETPLSLGVKDSITPEILECLLGYGADPNYTTGDYTPLLYVVQDPDKNELVRVLLENGADYTILSEVSGGSAMDYARGELNISYLRQVGCRKKLDFDPIEYDAYCKIQKEAETVPFRLVKFDYGGYNEIGRAHV